MQEQAKNYAHHKIM